MRISLLRQQPASRLGVRGCSYPRGFRRPGTPTIPQYSYQARQYPHSLQPGSVPDVYADQWFIATSALLLVPSRKESSRASSWPDFGQVHHRCYAAGLLPNRYARQSRESGVCCVPGCVSDAPGCRRHALKLNNPQLSRFKQPDIVVPAMLASAGRGHPAVSVYGPRVFDAQHSRPVRTTSTYETRHG